MSLAVSAAISSAAASDQHTSAPGTGGASAYMNPVLDTDFPDPAVLHARDGFYYAYATQGPAGNVQMARSEDLVHWQVIGDAMPDKPAWASETQNFWAPHVLETRRGYVLYFSSDRNGHGGDKCIGVATARSPGGPFRASAAPLVCGKSFEHIDPMAFEDARTGKAYLYWGSAFKPLRVRELSRDRRGFAPGSREQIVLRPSEAPNETLVEGAWLTERDGWYYLFYSGSDCCTLPRPSYHVMVARARSPLGPFQKRAQGPRGDSTILSANDSWIAPGHNAVVRDAGGRDWMLYHAAAASRLTMPDGFIRRPMLLDPIEYADGWPNIPNGSPSLAPQAVPSLEGQADSTPAISAAP